MEEALRRERQASSLDIEEITHFVDGNESMTERRREICEAISSHAVLLSFKILLPRMYL